MRIMGRDNLMTLNQLTNLLENLPIGLINLISIVGTITGILGFILSILTLVTTRRIKKELINRKISDANILIIKENLKPIHAMASAYGKGTNISKNDIHEKLHDTITSLNELSLYKIPCAFIKYRQIKYYYNKMEKSKYKNKKIVKDTLNKIYKYLNTIVEYLDN